MGQFVKLTGREIWSLKRCYTDAQAGLGFIIYMIVIVHPWSSLSTAAGRLPRCREKGTNAQKRLVVVDELPTESGV